VKSDFLSGYKGWVCAALAVILLLPETTSAQGKGRRGLAEPVTEEAIQKMVKAPPGFKVTLFAAQPNISYPTCLAASPNGDLFVGVDENGSLDAKPDRGRVVRCVDTNGDGRADQFTIFAKMDSPRGLWFDHGTLYVMHPPFLTAFHDDNGDGVTDRSEVLLKGLGFDLKFRGADHTVNGMRMAIDGWLYIAVGDYGAIEAVGKDGAKLKLHGGGIIRIRPDGSGLELIASGTRNIYDVAVDPLMNLFTRDNTNDGGGWDVRLSHIVELGYYGYPSHFRNFGDEIIQPLADYGGGSPCGSLFLDEPGFPAGMGTALYTCDWGRSVVYRHPLKPRGATFTVEQVPFIELPRPTDMEADGRSALYVSSWVGGQFNYAGPNVGFVVRVTPPGSTNSSAFPDLKTAADAKVLELLKSPSAVWRLHAQREILRRGSKRATFSNLETLAISGAPLANRVAAIYTLSQFDDATISPLLVKLSQKPELKEFALRALAERREPASQIPAKPFRDALADTNPRVRLQAATALGRLGKTETAEALLPLTADEDPIISHVAVKSLVALRAADVCLQAFDSASTANLINGAGRVLQALHESRVVDGLMSRLATTRESATKRIILRTLCRLAYREADWDGKWWGTRPDTSGPYFKTASWESTDKVIAGLKAELGRADSDLLRWFPVELQKNKVDMPELTPLVLKLAGDDPSFRVAAVELLTLRPTIPEEAVPLFQTVALSNADAALRAKALRALLRLGSTPALDAGVKALAAIAASEKPDAELNRAWEEAARDPRQARNLQTYLKLTTSTSAPERLLGYSVLLNLANHRLASAGAKAEAARAVENAWQNPTGASSLLAAIARTRSDQYTHQVRAHLTDTRPEVRQAAETAAKQLKIDPASAEKPAGPAIDSLPYEKVVAEALKEKGDSKIGAQLFLNQGCVACHTVSAEEPPKGPFLGGISTRYSRAELCESILKPGAKIAQGFETQWFSTQKGDEPIEGFVVREAGDEVEVRNVQGITTTIKKADIKERGKRETSMMPAGLLDKLTPGDLSSLLAYLESLGAK
jgi:putative membrane-bound dehydrogenase-like protein